MPPKNLGILISGRGSNMEAVVLASHSGVLQSRVACVVSSHPEALGLRTAESLGVPAKSVDYRAFPTRETFEDAILRVLEDAEVEVVVLAGFMRVLTPHFLRRYARSVVNVHPALLPAFPGAHAQAQAIAYGAKITGCTVHFVDEGVDTGPVIAQRSVLVEENDTTASLSKRLLVEEHTLLVSALGWLEQDRLLWDESGPRIRVHVRPEEPRETFV